MTRRFALVAGLVVLLAPAGCAAPTPSRPTASCDGGQLTVTFDGDAVRVTNHGAACQFAGRYPVQLKAWRIVGQVPPAVGTLPAGATYVQPYRGVGSNGCPMGSEAPSDTVSVVVENRLVLVEMSGREAREIKVCDAFAPGTPGVTVTYTPSGG